MGSSESASSEEAGDQHSEDFVHLEFLMMLEKRAWRESPEKLVDITVTAPLRKRLTSGSELIGFKFFAARI